MVKEYGPGNTGNNTVWRVRYSPYCSYQAEPHIALPHYAKA